MKYVHRALCALISTVALTASLAACTAPEGGSVERVEPAYSTPVPAPDGGTVEDVIESEPAPPEMLTVGLDQPAEVGGGVSARIDSVQSVDVEALTPGEVSGPAVVVTITITNDGDEAIDVTAAMVSLIGTDDILGQPTTSDPYQPFAGLIEPGASGKGVYVFLLPEDAQGAFDVSVQYRAGTTIARFTDEK